MYLQKVKSTYFLPFAVDQRLLQLTSVFCSWPASFAVDQRSPAVKEPVDVSNQPAASTARRSTDSPEMERSSHAFILSSMMTLTSTSTSAQTMIGTVTWNIQLRLDLLSHHHLLHLCLELHWLQLRLLQLRPLQLRLLQLRLLQLRLLQLHLLQLRLLQLRLLQLRLLQLRLLQLHLLQLRLLQLHLLQLHLLQLCLLQFRLLPHLLIHHLVMSSVSNARCGIITDVTPGVISAMLNTRNVFCF